jgi:tetratricopeptide (TPR) repeat protein
MVFDIKTNKPKEIYISNLILFIISVMKLSIDEALQQGIAAHKEGNIQEADRLYTAILGTQPKHPDANHNMGVLAVSIGKVDAALPFLKTALESNPKVEQFWLSYIDALIKLGQFDGARQVLGQAQQQVPTSATFAAVKQDLVLKIGGAEIPLNPPQHDLDTLTKLYQNKEYDAAEQTAISLTQRYPQHQLAWKVLGALLKQQGKKKEALYANTKASEIVPLDAAAQYNLANTFQELNRLKDAEIHYREAIRLKSDFDLAHNNYGTVLKGTGQIPEAQASYKKAIVLQPSFAQAQNNLGILFKELNEIDSAESSYRRTIISKNQFHQGYFNLGIVLQEKGKMREAEASYRKAIDIHPIFGDAHRNLGELLMRVGRHREGLSEIKKGSGIISFDLETGMSIQGGV